MANITKRGDSYRIRVFCGYDLEGRQKSVSKTWKIPDGMTARRAEKEAHKIAIQLEDEFSVGFQLTAIKFGIFIDQWLEECAKITIKEQTLYGYKAMMKRVKNEFSHMWLDKITIRDVQRFVGKLADIGLSAKTIKNYVSLVSTVYEYAVKMQMVSRNPCKGVRLPPKKSDEREIYTLAEIQRLIDLLLCESDENFQFALYFILAIATGCRRGELLGLEWKDFDLKSGLVTIKRAAYHTPTRGHYTDTPKTKKSRRTIMLPKEVIPLLVRYKEKQARYAESLGNVWVNTDRLFTAWNGEALCVSAPLDFIKRFCKKHGLQPLTTQSLRHFNASLLIEGGLDVKTVQAHMGHSEATTTLNIYAHEFQTAQARANKVISSALSHRLAM